MENNKKVQELIKISEQKTNLIEELKGFVQRSTFDDINNWLDTVKNKSEIFFIMLEFSKDDSMTEYLKIVEAYYKHNY